MNMSLSNANLEADDPSRRSEERQHVVHLVEYSRYPRRDPKEDQQVAYTQNRSLSGLGLDLPKPIEPGVLLRVTLRDIDGDVELDGLARVVWCQTEATGRARAGLSILQSEGQERALRAR